MIIFKVFKLGMIGALFLTIVPVTAENNIPSFQEGMSNYHEYYSHDLYQKNPDWRLLKNLYDTFIVNNTKPSLLPRIPKIIHQIWLGSPLPKRCQELQQTWLKLHPGWIYKLWTEKDIEAFGLKNKAFYDAATNYGEKSDIARYEILYRFGGLYIDCDFECLEPFDFFHHRCNFYTGLCVGKNKTINLPNGLIGSIPGHQILKECIETMNRPEDAKDDALSIIDRTGPFHFTRCFLRVVKAASAQAVVLPSNYFYPWPHYHLNENTPTQIQKWIKPESFGLHYWHRSWVK